MNADFAEYVVAAPTREEVAAQYRTLTLELDNADSGDAALAVVEAWDALRRRLENWKSLVGIRFHQDTRNTEYKEAREYCDQLDPKLTHLAVDMKRRLMKSRFRSAIEERFGSHVFNLWECDAAAFDPAIEADLVEEAQLDTRYTELLASAKFEFQGESLTLSELTKFSEHPHRDVRRDAARLRWGWFVGNQNELDEIFAALVQLRRQMAAKLGFHNFVEVGYQRMQRVDYGPAEVERFRRQVRDCVVPLAEQIRAQQSQRLGIDPLMAWDEGLFDPDGNPRPQGDHDWMIDRATEMFAELGHGMDAFFARMCSSGLIDLKSRDGKAGGGFCDALPEFGMPFIFANFNGTMGDVCVFTHEMGHAFQVFSSLDKPLYDHAWPTCESCEIHSMGLEFLSWPQMELFFRNDAERFRRLHLIESILFLPYGVAVDHFQHLVYEQPNCSPDDRAAMWQEMERTYLPSLQWGDLTHPASGRRWQAQLHIFGSPFYYIDYTLALTCALQFWDLAERDRGEALRRYVALCRRGGEAQFGELIASAGLTSPFEEGCLQGVVERARKALLID
ncbi:MAG: M3 family oligoendopeptidase [Planctomycetota bacterium]